MSELTEKDLNWFGLANANPAPGFYDFKNRFLKRFAVADGYDLQTIEKECFRCDATGIYGSYFENRKIIREGEICRSCGGTGIHHTAEHWLERWNLCGVIYHRPVFHSDVWHQNNYKYPEPVKHIAGRIQKGIARHVIGCDFEGVEIIPVSSAAAERAYFRLLLRHEPLNFYWAVINKLKWRGAAFKTKWHWRLLKLRNKMDLFPVVDDVPF